MTPCQTCTMATTTHMTLGECKPHQTVCDCGSTPPPPPSPTRGEIVADFYEQEDALKSVSQRKMAEWCRQLRGPLTAGPFGVSRRLPSVYDFLDMFDTYCAMFDVPSYTVFLALAGPPYRIVAVSSRPDPRLLTIRLTFRKWRKGASPVPKLRMTRLPVGKPHPFIPEAEQALVVKGRFGMLMSLEHDRRPIVQGLSGHTIMSAIRRGVRLLLLAAGIEPNPGPLVVTHADVEQLIGYVEYYCRTGHHPPAAVQARCLASATWAHPRRAFILRALRKGLAASRDLSGRIIDRALIAILLQRGGVEINPGPRIGENYRLRKILKPRPLAKSPAARLDEELRECYREPRGAAAAEASVQAVTAQSTARASQPKRAVKGRAQKAAQETAATLLAEQQKAQGEADAKAERDRDERAAEKAAKLTAEFRAQQTVEDAWPRDFWIRSVHPLSAGTDPVGSSFLPVCLTYSYDCGIVQQDMSACYTPHDLLHVRQVGTDRDFEPDGMDRRAYLLRSAPPVGGRRLNVYEVEQVSVGYFLKDVGGPAVPRALYKVSLDVLYRCHAFGIARSMSFEPTLKAVESIFSTQHSINSVPDPLQHGHTSHLIATALLLLRENVSNPGTFADQATKATVATVLRSVRPALPMAEGTYLRGYNAGLSEIVPTELLREGTAFVGRGLGTARRRARETVDHVRQACQAVALPIAFDGLIPVFPDRHDVQAMVEAAARRLQRAALPCQAVMREFYTAAAESLTDATTFDNPLPLTAPRDWPEAANSIFEARDPSWAPDQTQSYVLGALSASAEVSNDLLLALRGRILATPPGVMCGLIPLQSLAYLPVLPGRDLLEGCRLLGTFIKKEDYAPEKFKCLRFIVAPDHAVRGFAHAALCMSANRMFLAHTLKNIKHKRPEQITDMVANMSLAHALETDFENCEAQLRPWMRDLEIRIMAYFAPSDSARSAIALIQDYFATATQIRGPQSLKISVAPGIRKSGEWNTSAGNWIFNYCATTSVLARAHLDAIGGRLEEGVAICRAGLIRAGLATNLIFEGDDGMVVLHPGLAAKISAAADIVTNACRAMGVRLKFEAHDDVADAHFCGNSLTRFFTAAGAAAAVVRNPFELLAAITHDLDPDIQSAHQRAALQAAKCMSALHLYGHLPLVGPVVRAILRRLEELNPGLIYSVVTIRDQVATGNIKGGGRLVRYLRAEWAKALVTDESRYPTETLAQLLTPPDHVAPPTAIADFIGTSVTFLQNLETDMIHRVMSMPATGQNIPLVVAGLREWWHDKYPTVRRMTVARYEDVRAMAQRGLDRVSNVGTYVQGYVTLTNFIAPFTALITGGTAIWAMLAAFFPMFFALPSVWIFAYATVWVYVSVLCGLSMGLFILAWTITGRFWATYRAFILFLFSGLLLGVAAVVHQYWIFIKMAWRVPQSAPRMGVAICVNMARTATRAWDAALSVAALGLRARDLVSGSWHALARKVQRAWRRRDRPARPLPHRPAPPPPTGALPTPFWGGLLRRLNIQKRH